MAVSDNKDLIAGGRDLINSRIGARWQSNCFCFLFLLFEAAASVVTAEGGRSKRVSKQTWLSCRDALV
jgi:hypothetical protein